MAHMHNMKYALKLWHMKSSGYLKLAHVWQKSLTGHNIIYHIPKTALGSEGEPTPTTRHTPSTLPTQTKPDSTDTTPEKDDHKMAEPTSTPTSKAAKLDIPSDMPSMPGTEATPASEKTGKTEPMDSNVLQRKYLVLNQMPLNLNLNLKTVTTVISHLMTFPHLKKKILLFIWM